MNFRAELSFLILQTEAKRIRAVPVDEQQIVTAIAINVQNLNRLHDVGERNFLRFVE